MKDVPWTTGEVKFVIDTYNSGKTSREAAEIHNSKGYPIRSYEAVKHVISNYSSSRKRPATKRCRYTPEMDRFLKSNCGMNRKKLTEVFNEKFGTMASQKAITDRLSKMGYYWIEVSNPARRVKYIRGRKNEE